MREIRPVDDRGSEEFLELGIYFRCFLNSLRASLREKRACEGRRGPDLSPARNAIKSFLPSHRFLSNLLGLFSSLKKRRRVHSSKEAWSRFHAKKIYSVEQLAKALFIKFQALSESLRSSFTKVEWLNEQQFNDAECKLIQNDSRMDFNSHIWEEPARNIHKSHS